MCDNCFLNYDILWKKMMNPNESDEKKKQSAQKHNEIKNKKEVSTPDKHCFPFINEYFFEIQ